MVKGEIFLVRKLFTTSMNNWEISEQNNSEHFHELTALVPDVSTISNLVLCSRIMIYTMKCGTQQQDTELLKFAYKLAPHGAGFDDGETERDSSGPTRKKEEQRTRYCRKKTSEPNTIRQL